MFKVYTKFFITIFLKSLLYVFLVTISLAFILNLMSELDFFKELNVNTYFPLLLSLLNSPGLVFEMFPFIFLISTQLFFIKLFENREIDILKYSGLKTSKILTILSIIAFITGLVITLIFYNLSSSLKNFYLELKSTYTSDGKYLAVITNNGLWIKDRIDNKIIIVNSLKIDENFLIRNFITEFDNDFNVKRNIQSPKIDITNKEWLVYDAKIYKKNKYELKDKIYLKSNFDKKRIKSLYSNLSSLNMFELIELRNNYKRLNYSITEINLQILKLISYPIYLLLMTIFSALMMLRIKNIKGTTYKISIGLFFSVVIYYFNNFSQVLGGTERISIVTSIFVPLLILGIINSLMIYNINEK